jgi:hypothetical protein
MSIKKICGYIVTTVDSTSEIANNFTPTSPTTFTTTTNNQRQLCAVETCLDYSIFRSIFCAYHDAEAGKVWQSLDTDYIEPATNDETDGVIPTIEGQQHVGSQYRRRTRTPNQSATTTTYHAWTPSDGGDAV